MNFEQILTDLENKVYYPVYFLYGEEPYYIDAISHYIEENVLTETEQEFNKTVVYGKETDPMSIISYAKRFPMMANYQVVVIKEAQDIKEIEKLQPYVEKPLKSTLLVICYKYKKPDNRTVFAKTLKKNGVLFESKKLYENKIPDWIKGYLIKRGYTITPQACMLLSEHLGTELSRITNELGKLVINVPEGTEINGTHIEQNIGISKEFNIFELQKAIGTRNIVKANQIVRYFAANEKDNPLVKTLGILNNYFNKVLIYHQLKDKSRQNAASVLGVNPFFVNDYQITSRNYSMGKLEQIFSLMREYDLRSKGVNNASVTDGELLKELIFKIMH